MENQTDILLLEGLKVTPQSTILAFILLLLLIYVFIMVCLSGRNVTLNGHTLQTCATHLAVYVNILMSGSVVIVLPLRYGAIMTTLPTPVGPTQTGLHHVPRGSTRPERHHLRTADQSGATENLHHVQQQTTTVKC
ncbi:hypothetical protein JOB18_031198 [Solea senegalensis]|uniref:G-protein coupled receptors family 1 profile domain-containing protein n=1 Tax=Solea senegalensis TaxID=28829 RepID=A0AAV6SH74_SOLSE|nr:hypothetical protein JOB18_028790 [Solea senegalensis]KAG7516427.1 hypothetical protein JOB18_031198 [Solea senegalensis]